MQEESYGVIPLSKEKGYWEVFLIQHKENGYWGFPKGHGELDEGAKEAAFRELKEETNLELDSLIQEEPLLEQYSFIKEKQRVFKTVYYFVATVKGEVRLQVQEIYDGKWLPLTEAHQQLTHKEGKAILVAARSLL